MASRYGRNKKRRHLEEIAQLDGALRLQTRKLLREEDMSHRLRLALEAARAPLDRLREDALKYLAARVADAMGQAGEEFGRNAIAEIAKIARSSVRLEASEDHYVRDCVFKIRIPPAEYWFRADVRKMAER